MKLFLILLLSANIYAFKLKEGDILVQPLHCYLCNLIEAQTNSIYSHIGIVIADGEDVEIAEAFISVRKVSLKEFLSKTQKRQKVKVLRPRFEVTNLKYLFEQKFEGLSYDEKFLWENKDEKGEKIYCSELVYKMLRLFSENLPHPRPMKYNVNYDLWKKYFKSEPPSGKLGISPGMFDDITFFDELGEL